MDDKVGDNLTENQQQILQSMTVQPSITANELANIVKISKRKIEENIAKLKQKGIIQRIGPDKGGYWKVELKH
ncbi:MAG: winged helix-turn-helix transcriptional regulator [Bacteroidota bacterium]